MSLVVCDINVFISAFNGISDTAETLKTIGNKSVLMASITVMELLRGMNNKEELLQMLKKLKPIIYWILMSKFQSQQLNLFKNLNYQTIFKYLMQS